MKLRGSFREFALVTILLIICIGIIVTIQNNQIKPYEMSYEFSGPSGVFFGANELIYVIDGAKKDVVVIDKQGDMLHLIHGEMTTAGFYYASIVCSDDEDNIYIADTLYADKGTIIKAERIVKYDNKGKYHSIIQEIVYDDDDDAPLQYGNIYSMKYAADALVYSVRTKNGIDVVKIDLDGNGLDQRSFETGNDPISSIEVNTDTLLPMYITRTGEIVTMEADGTSTPLLSAEETGIPWKLDIHQGQLYYSDLSTKEIRRLNSGGDQEVVLTGEDILFTVSVDRDRIMSTDYGGIYLLEGEEETYISAIDAGSILISIQYTIAIIAGLATFIYLAINAAYSLKGISKNQTFQKAMIIITVALLISAVVIYLSLTSMFNYVNQNVMKDLNLYGEIMIEATDVEDLLEIDDISDYRGPAYTRIKHDLDNIVEASYNNGIYYYYIIYKHDEEQIIGIMDYEDTMTTDHPFYEWGDNSYTDVFLTKEGFEFSNDVSSYGTWSFVLHPILDEEDNVVGIMEVGANTDEIVKNQNNLIREIIVTVLCSVAIMIIVMLELVFFVHYRNRKAQCGKGDGCGFMFPVRNLIFVSFLADSMQDAFIPILVSKRYVSILGIGRGVGIALPITAQLFMTAIFSFIGGGIVTRIGIKKTLIQGFLIQMTGYIICALTTDYVGILIGKSVVGIGMGLIIVVINTIAAVAKKDSAVLFGEINAGILAGVTAGVGIGAVMLSRVGYREVYIVAAFIILCGFAAVIAGEDYQPSKDKRIRADMRISQFVFNRQIITFLVLILTPFLIALSYREYFFPLYAQSMGVTESNIGYLYLISGLIVIYLGPTLTKNLIDWLGEKRTVVLASALMCSVSLIFGLFSTISAAIIGIFVLSIAISFGYAAQSTYFASRPIANTYGEGRAMGVYTLFDNGGQTLGPILYGASLSFGYQPGVAVVGIILAVLAVLFVGSNVGR